MESLQQALASTLDHQPQVRSQAELTINQLKLQPHFGLQLISISQDPSIHLSIRQSAALAFKNYIKSAWNPIVNSSDLSYSPSLYLPSLTS